MATERVQSGREPEDNRPDSHILKNRISTASELGKYLDLKPEVVAGIHAAEREFSWHTTAYYAGLMDRSDPGCPIRMQAVPDRRELEDPLGLLDPLDEEQHNPAPNVIKVYPDRVAWCVSNICPVLCRHCLRKRMVGREHFDFSTQAREAAFSYFERTEQIRDVLITGGDPLMLPEALLEELLARLRRIKHIEIIRIGSRAPCTMPERITEKLCGVLKKYHPLWLNTQFNHPKELTEEALGACTRLVEAGIPLGNQSVLLKGINYNLETMKKLVQGLVRFRVRPYYLYQAQLLAGTAHFRTPVEVGIEIIRGLRGYTTGFAVPNFVLDTPYGKIPMAPSFIVKRDDEAIYLRSFQGKVWKEPNPRRN